MKVLTVIGTRPEAIKMAPVLMKLAKTSGIESRLCVTAQHRDMLDQALALFDLQPDVDLDIMRPGQTPSEVTAAVLRALDPVLAKYEPDIVLVHGDTTTTFSAALAAFYRGIPVGHVEAGLRTGDMCAPWPEEANRRLTGTLATIHFAPTDRAKENLLREGGAAGHIHVTGNTVIDALLWMKHRLDTDTETSTQIGNRFGFLRDGHRLVLITGHRRENFGDGFDAICRAIAALAERHSDVDFLYPVHLNPNVQEPVNRILSGHRNVHLVEPLDYRSCVWAMERSFLILTDSGGIQEEAPSLGKPVLVMREVTERPEAIEAGTAMLVGADFNQISDGVASLLTDVALYRRMAETRNPYGSGHAAEAIVNRLLAFGARGS